MNTKTIAEKFSDRVIPGTLVTLDGVSFDELAVSYGAAFSLSNGFRKYTFSDNSSLSIPAPRMECKTGGDMNTKVTIADQFADHIIPGTTVTLDGISFDELAEKFGAVFNFKDGIREYTFSDNSSISIPFPHMV